jgi:APA family basic amino acid/polyamine antiporter
MVSSQFNSLRTDNRSKLGPLSATSLVVGNIIGAGLFTTTGYLAQLLGASWLVVCVWLLGGLIAFFGATAYGELGAMMPRSGGEYVYLSKAFHPAVGFISGWISLLVGFSAPIAVAGFAFGAYVQALMPVASPKAVGGALIVTLTACHLFDLVWGGRFTTVITAIKVFLIGVFVIGSLLLGDGQWNNLLKGDPVGVPSTIAIALVLVSYSYSGWNVAAYIAGDLNQPTRILHRVLLLGTGIAVCITLAVNTVYIYAVSPQVLAAAGEDIGALAGYALFGEPGRNAMTIIIALALVSSMSAMIMAGPRVYTAMSEDQMFFRVLAKRNKAGIPWVSVCFQSVLSLVLLFSSTYLVLLTYVGFTLSIVSMFSVSAVFVLRRREPETPRPYRALGWPYSGALFLASSGLMVVYMIIERPQTAFSGLLTIFGGFVLYHLWRLAKAYRIQQAATNRDIFFQK